MLRWGLLTVSWRSRDGDVMSRDEIVEMMKKQLNQTTAEVSRRRIQFDQASKDLDVAEARRSQLQDLIAEATKEKKS